MSPQLGIVIYGSPSSPPTRTLKATEEKAPCGRVTGHRATEHQGGHTVVKEEDGVKTRSYRTPPASPFWVRPGLAVVDTGPASTRSMSANTEFNHLGPRSQRGSKLC